MALARSRLRNWRRWTALAACCAVVVLGARGLLRSDKKDMASTPAAYQAPKIQLYALVQALQPLRKPGKENRLSFLCPGPHASGRHAVQHLVFRYLGTVKSRISRARNALRKILLESGNLSGYLPSKHTEVPVKGRDGREKL